MEETDMDKMRYMIENELSLTRGGSTIKVSLADDLVVIRSRHTTVHLLDMYDNTYRVTVRVLFGSPVNMLIIIKDEYLLKSTGEKALVKTVVKEYIQVAN